MIHITVSVVGTEQLLSYEVDPLQTVGDLKSFVHAETGQDLVLRLNGRILSDASQTISGADVKDNDLISAIPPATPQTNLGPARQSLTETDLDDYEVIAEVERYRLRIIDNPTARAELARQAPQLESAVGDRDRFRTIFRALEANRRRDVTRHEVLNDDMNPEAQAAMLETIRKENVEREMNLVIRDHPELMTRVTMLYINLTVNGHPVKAFVDSGAQATILSPKCAEECGITHLIDDRWRGIARGVGTAQILGRVHRANVKIGYDELPCSCTVMEGKEVEMLLGLDMLKRYQACIDLSANCLRFPGGQEIPFLPESEIPKPNVEEEPTVEGPDGTAIGAKSGALKESDAGSTSGEASARSSAALSSKSAAGLSSAGNFGGQGRSLGPASSTPAQPQRQQQPQQPQSRPVEAAGFPQTSINTLLAIGATREQAIQALRACNGNVDAAASMLFEGSF